MKLLFDIVVVVCVVVVVRLGKCVLVDTTVDGCGKFGCWVLVISLVRVLS